MSPRRRRRRSSSTSSTSSAAATTSTRPSPTARRETKTPAPAPFDASTLPTPSLTNPSLRHSYRIGRGEQGVLTFEPYKSLLLPHWRFRTATLARASAATLRAAFDAFVAEGDFVGADMARKFLQMGMTRARRYANYAGGRKYVDGSAGEDGERVAREKSAGHAGREEKVRASEIFEEVWRECREDGEYLRLKEVFQEEQKGWDKERRKREKEEKGRKSLHS